MPRDVLVLEGIEVWSHVGVYDIEKSKGQLLQIDCRMYLDLEQAMRTNDLNHTIHYGEVCLLLKKVAQDTKVDLLEALAGEMFAAVFAEFPLLATVKLRIKKTKPPIDATLAGAGVSIMRSREQWHGCV